LDKLEPFQDAQIEKWRLLIRNAGDLME